MVELAPIDAFPQRYEELIRTSVMTQEEFENQLQAEVENWNWEAALSLLNMGKDLVSPNAAHGAVLR